MGREINGILEIFCTGDILNRIFFVGDILTGDILAEIF